MQLCAATLQLGGQTPPDCATEVDVFNPPNLLFSSSPVRPLSLLWTFSVSQDCSNPPGSAPAPGTNITCPPYFAYSNVAQGCEIGCVFPPFHDRKRNQITTVTSSHCQLDDRGLLSLLRQYPIAVDALCLLILLSLTFNRRTFFATFFLFQWRWRLFSALRGWSSGIRSALSMSHSSCSAFSVSTLECSSASGVDLKMCVEPAFISISIES